MHEMSLCESVLRLIEDSAESNHFSKVKTVWLEIGSLAAVEPEAMRFNFDLIMKGTLVEGAKLELIEVPATAWCTACEKDVEISQRYDGCPCCGETGLTLSSGDEMRIRELEVV
ncbi:MAG: hydrogenase maturation nickel metallochaperone HypA [Mariprofundaceae bacterium]|jgi:hydrogenase nickel incorporation protein HypA/HybF|nr:hydrogenase maturation nickel metallochaperone HypA [Mariprofundaceae bacterium]